MSYKIEGVVHAINEPQTFASGFTKREIVIETQGDKYPQQIVIEFLQDKVETLDDIRMGDTVSVSFDIRGREYNGRYFNNLVGWNIRNTDDTRTGEPVADKPSDAVPGGASGTDDDISF